MTQAARPPEGHYRAPEPALLGKGVAHADGGVRLRAQRAPCNSRWWTAAATWSRRAQRSPCSRRCAPLLLKLAQSASSLTWPRIICRHPITAPTWHGCRLLLSMSSSCLPFVVIDPVHKDTAMLQHHAAAPNLYISHQVCRADWRMLQASGALALCPDPKNMLAGRLGAPSHAAGGPLPRHGHVHAARGRPAARQLPRGGVVHAAGRVSARRRPRSLARRSSTSRQARAPCWANSRSALVHICICTSSTTLTSFMPLSKEAVSCHIRWGFVG